METTKTNRLLNNGLYSFTTEPMTESEAARLETRKTLAAWFGLMAGGGFGVVAALCTIVNHVAR